MSLGKCVRCDKIVYKLEAITAGPPGKTQIFHKGCFKCKTCNWQLNLTNYKFWEDEPFCKNHYPVTGFGDHSAKHVSGTVETNSKHLESQLNAPKLDTVNQTVRGPQDIKPTTTVDSIGIANALKAPKSTPYNQTVRARFCVSCGKAAEGVATNSCPGCGNQFVKE